MRFSEGSSADGDRIVVANSRGVGIAVLGGNTVADLRDVRVSEALAWECTERDWIGIPCPIGFGFGIAVVDAQAGLTRFAVESASLAGISAQSAAVVHANTGTISLSSVGVNDQSQSFNPAEHLEDVVMDSNGLDLGTEDLPVPEIGGFFDGLGD